MSPHDQPRVQCCRSNPQNSSAHHRRGFWRRWLLINSLISGVCAIAWLILRSGTKPSRLTYPCQQAALSSATLAFGGPLVATLITARSRIISGLRTRTGLAAASIALFAVSGIWGYISYADEYRGPRLDPPPGYRAQVFQITDCPQQPVTDRFVGVDNLISLMGSHNLKFYRSDTVTLTSGPDGIIAPNDVLAIKINYQWSERGGTNTDVLRGVIRRIVDHPDGFTGEIVICENAQFASVSSFNRSRNNAEDITLSPHDIVVEFQAEGHTISHYDWTARRYTQVDEYSDGDTTDGYIVYAYDSVLRGRISYPKFQTNYGTQISLKYGLWDSDSGTYDRERLKFINMPVLKSHSATYGATVCVKDYMGVVTRELSTNSHSAIRYGILGAQLGEIQLADLNILDCIWINANPRTGPSTPYGGALRRDMLVASVDPVAADIWSVKNILIPGFYEEGFTPPWPNPSADPDNPSSAFRTYLDNSMSQILAAGYSVTNDPDQIDAIIWNGAGDLDGDCEVGLADLAILLASYGAIGDATYYDGDLNQNGDVDLADLAELLAVYGTTCP